MSVGTLVWARDACGDYYKATIKAERGVDDACEVRIHFHGWNATWDEWVPADSDGLKPWPGTGHKPKSAKVELEWVSEVGLLEADDQQYEVDNLLRKRRRAEDGADEYLVKWKGWASSYNTWQNAEDIDEDLIKQFIPPPKKVSRREPLGPYVLTVDDPIAPAVSSLLVNPWLATVGRKAAGLLARQKVAWAHKMLEHMDTCPAWAFKALHARLEQMGAALPGVHPKPKAAPLP